MTAPQIDEARLEQYRAMIEEELESGWLYDRLADQCRNPATAATLRDLAAAERDHAAHWAGLLGDRTLLERPPRPRWRTRWLALLARVGGLSLVVPRLRSDELANIRLYAQHPEAGTLAEEEREHRAVLGRLTEPGRFAEAEHGFASSNAASLFRASLFGFNDGLVSNLSLVAGVAGASIQGDTVLLAGVAGLLAGAFSMSAGEYLSVRSQAELLENQIAKERLELELDPDEERAELLRIYRDKGVSDGVARDVVDELMKDPEQALDTLAREELGLDPNELASPWGAAGGSLIAFALGAIVPVLPFIVGSGYSALVAAIIAGAVTLGVVGAFTSLLTGRNPLYAGGRMVVIGLAATGVTFGIGSVLPIG